VRKLILVVVFLAICPMLVAQQALNNDSIIKLVKAGLSDDLIVSTINASAGNYDSSAEGIIALKTAGASDKVIAAIVAKAAAPVQSAQPVVISPPPPIPVQAPAAAPASASAPDVPPPPFHSTDGKIRIYVTDHPIFESNGMLRASGDRHGSSAAAISHVQAGDDPRTVEVQADIQKVCPTFVMASNNPDRADYVLVFRRRGGERSSMFAFGGLSGLALSAAMKVDGASLFENTGDMLYATKKNSIVSAIRDICEHIPPPGITPAQSQPPVSVPPPPPPTN